MDIWVATGNSGKLKEFKMLLEPMMGHLDLHHQNELPAFTPRPETGKTYLENARIKAKSLKAVKDKDWVFGDDSGLEVPAMGGLPGVHSARYAGENASDSENLAKLLKMMTIRGIQDRKAKFVCTLVVYTPDNQEWVFEGELTGVIAKSPSGLHGFGYDPIFIPDGQTQSLAELGPGFKLTQSHRAKALKSFLEKYSSFSAPV